MTAYCGAAHPLEPETYCNRSAGNHKDHSAYSFTEKSYIDWPNENYREPPKIDPRSKRSKRDATALLEAIAYRATPESE